MNLEAERTRGRLEAQVREASNIEQRMTRADQESSDLEGRIGHNETERAALAQSVAELEREMQEVRTGLLEKNQARDAIQMRVREAEKTIESSRSVILRLLGEASTIRNQIAQADTYLAGIERERTRVQKEEEVAAAEIERLAGVKEQLSERIAQRQLEMQSVITEPPRDRGRPCRKAPGRWPNFASRSTSLRAECSRLRAKRESIENILSHHSYTTESTKKLLAALENGRAGQFRPEGVLADFIEVDPAWERAAEEFLHDELEYVVVQDWSQAEQSMNLLRAELEGRATFLVEGGPVAAEPGFAQGPELPRLVRSDQVHQRPFGTDARSFAAAFRVLSGERSRTGPRHGGCLSRPPFSACRRPVLQRPHADRRTQEGQRTAGAQARNARIRGAVEGAGAARSPAKVGDQEALQRETTALEAELERLRQLQQIEREGSGFARSRYSPRGGRNQSRQFAHFGGASGTRAAEARRRAGA